jgi:hypothetical protein
MDGKPHGKISSRHFPKKPTESFLSVKSCVRQLTVLLRKGKSGSILEWWNEYAHSLGVRKPLPW